MKISSEVKVGLIGISTLLVLIWGINYLKGRNILNSTYTLHAFYSQSGGLEKSSPVLMNGIKIGYIDDIELLPGRSLPVHVVLHIEKKYPLVSGSTAVLFSEDLLGTKAIRMEPSDERGLMQHQDTIITSTEADMLSSITGQVAPLAEQIGSLAESLEGVVLKLDTLLGSDAPALLIEDLTGISGALSASLNPGGALHESFRNLESFTSMMESQEEEIASLTGHLNSISESLDSAGIDQIAEELKTASGAFSKLMEQVASGNGSLGKLIYSDTLYAHLQNLVTDLDSLIVDLNENPGDYVHFSLFGK